MTALDVSTIMKGSSADLKETDIKSVNKDIFAEFDSCTIAELEGMLAVSQSKEEKVFYRTLINLKMQFAQEKIVGETLL